MYLALVLALAGTIGIALWSTAGEAPEDKNTTAGTAAAPDDKTGEKPEEPLPPGVIAEVNGEPITHEEFMRGLLMVYAAKHLHCLMEIKAVEREARRLHLTASEEEIDKKVDEEIEGIYESVSGDKQAAAASIYHFCFAGVETYRHILRMNARHKLLQQKIIAFRHTSPAKLKKLYEKRFGKNRGEMVRARLILVINEETALELIKKLKSGADFAELARSEINLAGTIRKAGGDTGFFARGDKFEAVENAAFGLKAGELLEKPVKGMMGYYVIKLIDKREPGGIPFEEVKGALIKEITNSKSVINNRVLTELIKELTKDVTVRQQLYDTIIEAPKQTPKEDSEPVTPPEKEHTDPPKKDPEK
jgi:foldase protein PrsA